jgi:hypothetical protein
MVGSLRSPADTVIGWSGGFARAEEAKIALVVEGL